MPGLGNSQARRQVKAGLRSAARGAASWAEARHPRDHAGKFAQVSGDDVKVSSIERGGDIVKSVSTKKSMAPHEVGQYLHKEFDPVRMKPRLVVHPSTGKTVKVGVERKLRSKDKNAAGFARTLISGGLVSGQKTPAFDVYDHGGVDDKRKFKGQEAVTHVYRGMSDGDWKRAQRKGKLSGGRTVVPKGWKAAVHPAYALDHIDNGDSGVILKIKADAWHRWEQRSGTHVHSFDEIPTSVVEHVAKVYKDRRGGVRIHK